MRSGGQAAAAGNNLMCRWEMCGCANECADVLIY